MSSLRGNNVPMHPADSGRAHQFRSSPEAVRQRALAAAGRLPPRYAEDWYEPFAKRAARALRPGISVLDVGSGRTPAITVSERPPGCSYVGLDVSGYELAQAPRGVYDEAVCADIAAPVAGFDCRFDLIVSWQVLEHVKPLPEAIALMRSYLRPGGRMVAQLSGGLSAFALAGRLIPHRVTTRLMVHLLGTPPDRTFRTHYDRCRFSALERIFSEWSEYEVIPRYRGAGYLSFARPLECAYLGYEEWIYRRGISELATHYLIDAVR